MMGKNRDPGDSVKEIPVPPFSPNVDIFVKSRGIRYSHTSGYEH